MVKIALLGIVTVMLAVHFKSSKPEYNTYLGVVACLIIFFLGMSNLEIIIETINKIQSYVNINPTYVTILLKIIGITYIAEFASSICKDAGHGAIAGQIEIFGKLSILVISMPILLALLDTLTKFLTS